MRSGVLEVVNLFRAKVDRRRARVADHRGHRHLEKLEAPAADARPVRHPRDRAIQCRRWSARSESYHVDKPLTRFRRETADHR